jgi:hypothetical protein
MRNLHLLVRLLVAIVAVFAGLNQTPARASKSAAQQEFEDDPSMLTINCERWSALIRRSNEGLDLREQSRTGDLDSDAQWLLRADHALKEDAAMLLLLRNRLLELGLYEVQSVRTTAWPRWIFEPPSASETPETLTARLNWIETEAEKLVGIGCDVGRKKSDNSLFCSVE